MDKEKEIRDELIKAVFAMCNSKGHAKYCPERIGTALYNAGYRKADDLIAENKTLEHLVEIKQKAIKSLKKEKAELADEVRKETYKQVYEWLKGFFSYDEEGCIKEFKELFLEEEVEK